MEDVIQHKLIQGQYGKIPEDWVESSLGEVSDFINDGTHHTPSYKPTGKPFYSVENVVADDYENVKFISKEEQVKCSTEGKYFTGFSCNDLLEF